MPERKTLNEDLFYKGSSANLPRLHTCENKTQFWDKSKFFASQLDKVLQSFSFSKATNVRAGKRWIQSSTIPLKNWPCVTSFSGKMGWVNTFRDSFRSVVVNVLVYDIQERVFELQSDYYVHFQINTLEKSDKPVTPQL